MFIIKISIRYKIILVSNTYSSTHFLNLSHVRFLIIFKRFFYNNILKGINKMLRYKFIQVFLFYNTIIHHYNS